ncbi:MAG: polysaccharide pyruvyl transferase family protein [Bauldia sp.]|nr:polysaccharide pyruvyl transferase family protein [Bauldia sp.]MCW5718397.1 polysaccharide pyruvyl transferase family protein [Bauldia sp.]
MRIRTYYWHDRIISRPRLAWRRLVGQDTGRNFVTGNAGDLFGPDIIRRRYGLPAVNDETAGKRLLVVGSIAHRAREGDVLAGPGLQSVEGQVPPSSVPLRIWGLRGPKTYDAFKAAGHDLGEVRFLLDPGLMIRFTMSGRAHAAPRGVIFIPHHRERLAHAKNMPPSIRLVDVDTTATRLGEAILGAELVYASSLHGIIFAHALNRPCVMVRPAKQAMFKYEDYFASLGLPFPAPLPTIHEADFRAAPVSPADIALREEDFVFPDIATLREAGIAR